MPKRQETENQTRREPSRWATYGIWALLCVGSLAVLLVESHRSPLDGERPAGTATVDPAPTDAAVPAPAGDDDTAANDTAADDTAADDTAADDTAADDTAADDTAAETPPGSEPDEPADLVPALAAEIVLDGERAALVFRESPWIASDVGPSVESDEDGAMAGEAEAPITLDLPGGHTVRLHASQLWVGNPIELPAQSLDDLERANYAMRLRTERFQVPIRAAAPPTTELVWQAVAGRYRVADGRFRVPVRVHAREKTGDVLRAAIAPATTRFLIEAPGTVAEPVEVTIEEGATRSEPAFVLLEPGQVVRLVATALGDSTPPSPLEISWREHGPKALALEVKPTQIRGYATPAAVTRLSLRLLVDGRPTPWPTEPSVEAPPALHLEPPTVDLTAGTATLDAWAGHSVDGTIHVELPDLGLRETIPVRVVSPWKYLAIAALLGIVGLVVAKRKTLFVDRGRWEIALEVLAALAGGAFLYFSYLAGWMPLDVDLLGEPQAGAVGILGGYVGDGVFLLVARGLRLIGSRTD